VTDASILEKARGRLAADRARVLRGATAERRAPPMGTTWRPTPTPYEANLRATSGAIPMTKVWDTSPVDAWAFDPTQPPDLVDAPVCTVQPNIALIGSLEVGQQLAGAAGTWSGSPTYARQWDRDGAPIAGATAPGYTLVAADIGAMIGLTVTATNSGGSASANALPVGPVVASRRR
jgi:hypothetical protein